MLALGVGHRSCFPCIYWSNGNPELPGRLLQYPFWGGSSREKFGLCNCHSHSRLFHGIAYEFEQYILINSRSSDALLPSEIVISSQPYLHCCTLVIWASRTLLMSASLIKIQSQPVWPWLNSSKQRTPRVGLVSTRFFLLKSR